MAGGKGKGGRLNRSETVTVRLDPKLNYLCELAARVHRRTKSSLIEATVASSLAGIPIDTRVTDQPVRSIAELAEALWDVDEVERLRRLAGIAPHLMSYEEQKIWATISRKAHFWAGTWRELDYSNEYFMFSADPAMLWTDRVREHWATIRRVAAGDAEDSVLPHMDQMRPKELRDITKPRAVPTHHRGS